MKDQNRGHRRGRRSRLKYFFLIVQFAFLFVLLAVIGVGAMALYQVSQRLPTIEELGLSSAATRIYSADGVLLARLYRENRDYVRLKEIPQNLQDATIAIEDDRFYTHAGVDLRGIGRALVSNVRGGRLGQGGSTITQQLARNAYDLGKQKTISRKLQEAVVAMRLERKYSKQEILEGYLNEVYYGAKAYGVQAASMQYFGKPAAKLTLAEAALLAGMPQRPTEFNPYKNMDAAKDRRNIVLARMAELGYVSPHEARVAMKAPIKLAYKRQDLANDWKAPYFVDYVIRELEKRYDPDQIYRGGLEVHTSLLYSMQTKAEEAVDNGLARAAAARLISPKTQSALTCVDPHNGYVRAMVGGKSWDRSQFNRAINNKRQPGSSFKIFVYTAALNQGWNQWRTVNDSPKSWRQASGKWWSPGNYDGRWRGPISLRTAVAYSVNMVAIKTAEAVGIRNAIELARKLGLEGPLHPVLATAIGAGGASTLEMASAYGAFAVKGQYIKPVPITEVRDRNGNVLERANPDPVQVVRPEVANEMDDMLRAVVTEGTARKIGAAVPDAFGKTGTTQDDRDAWFVGFTPQLATAVWLGNDDYTPMHHAFGGQACGPIWVDFMQHALKINPKNRPDFTNKSGAKPAAPSDTEVTSAPVGADGMVTLKICPDSGLIATTHCPHWRTRRFKPEDAPTEPCDIHTGTPLSPTRVRSTELPRDTSNDMPEAAGREPDTVTTRPAANTADPYAETPAPRHEAAGSGEAYGTVVLCADTGLRANAYCPRTVTRRETAATPTAYCDVHGPGNPG